MADISFIKWGSSFSGGQFSIDGFAKLICGDWNKNGGLVSTCLPSDTGCLFTEFNIRKAKWLVAGCYHPLSQNDDYYLCNLSKALDSLNSIYETFLIISDFNSKDF